MKPAIAPPLPAGCRRYGPAQAGMEVLLGALKDEPLLSRLNRRLGPVFQIMGNLSAWAKTMAHPIRRKRLALQRFLGSKNRIARAEQLPVMKDCIRRRKGIDCSMGHLLLAGNLFCI